MISAFFWPVYAINTLQYPESKPNLSYLAIYYVPSMPLDEEDEGSMKRPKHGLSIDDLSEGGIIWHLWRQNNYDKTAKIFD